MLMFTRHHGLFCCAVFYCEFASGRLDRCASHGSIPWYFSQNRSDRLAGVVRISGCALQPIKGLPHAQFACWGDCRDSSALTLTQRSCSMIPGMPPAPKVHNPTLSSNLAPLPHVHPCRYRHYLEREIQRCQPTPHLPTCPPVQVPSLSGGRRKPADESDASPPFGADTIDLVSFLNIQEGVRCSEVGVRVSDHGLGSRIQP